MMQANQSVPRLAEKFYSRFLLLIYRTDFSRVEKTNKEKRSADISLDALE
jgi:hypothetical protein